MNHFYVTILSILTGGVILVYGVVLVNSYKNYKYFRLTYNALKNYEYVYCDDKKYARAPYDYNQHYFKPESNKYWENPRITIDGKRNIILINGEFLQNMWLTYFDPYSTYYLIKILRWQKKYGGVIPDVQSINRHQVIEKILSK